MKLLTVAALCCLLPLHADIKSPSPQIESIEEWSYSLALQAASWGSPLVTMYALRHNDAVGPHAKAEPNSIWRMQDISTPTLSKEAGYVTPNVNVIYGFGFMDLSREPIVLEVPNSNNRYYMVEIVDMWTNAFAYVGGRATGYKGGKFVLVGPNWKGLLPTGLKRIDCPTPWVLLQPRVHIYTDGKVDLPGAKRTLLAIKTMGLAQFKGSSPPPPFKHNYLAPEPINPDLPVSALAYKDPLQFWEILSDAMNENPPPKDQITALLPMFEPLGIQLGRRWDRTKVGPKVLEAMKEAAAKIGSILETLPVGVSYQGALIPAPTIGNPGTDYKTRAIIARIGLTANTPYESVYWIYTMDKNESPLTGAKQYTMTFKEGLPYYEPGFWSLTMYDAASNYTTPNPINRYMLGSDTHDLKKNADGSFTIYIQNTSPGKEKESNWLPSPPGPFYLIPRAYAPKPETIDILTDVTSWPIPAVVPVE
ncbi:MAG: DUF1254 domain-containing protein [Chlamydiales bacterium]|nr:DUF1254 domain-containing protein [Chlamydiales bacterium]